MGFLDKLKAMFGISAAEVDLALQSGSIRLGEPVAGRVTLSAGGVKQDVRSLTVKVIKRVTTAVNPEAGSVEAGFDQAGDVPGPETTVEDADQSTSGLSESSDEAAEEEVTVAEAALAEDFELCVGDRKSYDFSLDLGEEAEPSSERVTWVLFAGADIPAAVDATCWRAVEVTPAE